jgi:chromosomal replication initiator protein
MDPTSSRPLRTSSLWSSLQRELREQLNPEEFETWFEPLRVRSEDPERLVLLAPNKRILHQLEECYRPMVDRALAGLDGEPFEVQFTLESGERPALTAPPREENQLNPRYLFRNFVVGPSNQFAYAAARAVAEKPSRSYNPLFLYGGVGLGKTHLLHAIGHEIQELHPELVVRYLAAEQFVNELINSIRFDRMPAFRERYRNIDVLLIDDIQFIANKERTQEEFFHTFNTLYSSRKQIILSSDSSPRDITTLEERLRSRFEWGLIADIQAPDLETRVVILRRKAEAEGIPVPEDVADFVARQVRSSVRELEGLLNRVIAFSTLTGKRITVELAQETLRDILAQGPQRIGAPDIVKAVARHYGLKVSEIKSRTNAKQIAFPRHVAMYLCRRLTSMSLPEIGKQFNNKHHSTVKYSIDKIEELRRKDEDLDRTLRHLEDHFA